MADTIEVNEKKRIVVTPTGFRLSLYNVTEVDLSGNWGRLKCKQGYVLINPEHVLAYIISGEKVR